MASINYHSYKPLTLGPRFYSLGLAIGAFLSFNPSFAFDSCYSPALVEGIVSSKVAVRHKAEFDMAALLIDDLFVIAHF